MILKNRRVEIIAVLLLAITFVQILYIIISTSLVMDEQFYPGVGKYTVTTGEYSPFAYRYHPALAYFINSIFLYTDNNPVWQHTPFDMMFVMRPYGVDSFLFLTRLPIAFTVLLLGIFVFKWSRKLYGDRAALFSLFLLSFEPTLLANGAVTTTDAVTATFMFIAMYFLWEFHRNKTFKLAAVSGAAMGLAVLSKFTALVFLLLAILIFILYFRPVRRNWRHLLIYLVVVFAVVWAFYGFQTGTMMDVVHSRERAVEFIDERFPGNGTRSVVLSLMSLPLPAPVYVNGAIGYTIYQASEGVPTFFFGQYIAPKYGFEFWYYHISAFLIKEPLSLLLLIGIFLFTVVTKKRKINWKDEKFIIIPLLVVLLMFSFFINIKIGIRHILPMYPFLFVLLGSVINTKFRNNLFKYVLALLCIWYVFAAATILPNNMAYFNELVGGPQNGYLYLTDSNIDWGQGAKQLASYLVANNIQNPKIDLMLPKPEYVNLYMTNYSQVPCNPQTGLYFLGVSRFTYPIPENETQCYKWLHSYKPSGNVGYTILIFNITSTGI